MEVVKIGSFVKSIKGRDIDNIYIVKNVLNGKVELIDGYGKKLENPKVKNLKHICAFADCAESIKNKLLNNAKIFNEEVYSAIRKFKQEKGVL